MVKVNGESVVAFWMLVVQNPLFILYVQKLECLPWRYPYTTASFKKNWFRAVKITLEIEGKEVDLAVGVSPHIQVFMLIGQISLTL